MVGTFGHDLGWIDGGSPADQAKPSSYRDAEARS